MKTPAIFRLHLIVFLWGFTAILGKLISADAPNIVFYRMSFAAIFLYIFIRFIQKRSLQVPKVLFFQLIGIGGMMAIHWFCFFHAIKVSNVAIALCCLATSTLFASIMEPIVFKRKLDVSEVVIGVIILACISLIFKIEFQYKVGIFYGILAALFGTFFSVFNGKLYGKTTSGNIIFYEIFGGWALAAIFFTLSGQIFEVTEINYRDLALITILAGVFTAYPMLESVSLMKYISPFTLILTVNLEPVYGIILAFFIFGESEKMTPIFYIASMVMIVAIVINGILKNRKAKKAKKLIEE
ncbi:DMT family transporter [Frigoriflavimonas asaccharolytica]|uniref:Drug/metabolite transporter (DMT)-like permease n=1 Tax=Frigoriflavimonas asaccharolytica TaxID=2735899 RepID=A0A8J8G4X2_9FLAO|nr:DMT family transporter [Frigoriflavimonas asaccharolytica]NRS91361.1 drug/metabolite transporter (DMT)-like permease [Frigoriflavimonas asaccharolytica]